MIIIALRGICLGDKTYPPGSRLPTHNKKTVEAWVAAGSAVILQESGPVEGVAPDDKPNREGGKRRPADTSQPQ